MAPTRLRKPLKPGPFTDAWHGSFSARDFFRCRRAGVSPEFLGKKMETTNWKPSTCQHFISFLVSALLYVTCFRYSNVDLGKSPRLFAERKPYSNTGLHSIRARWCRGQVVVSLGCSMMFYTFLSATCVNI